MKQDKDKICLYSGRFDRPHPGHIRTAQELGARFGKVLVVVLNHAEQMFPVQYRAQILREILENSKGTYEVVVNNLHFGQISVDEFLKYDFDVYAAGNLSVLKHLEHAYFTSITATERRHIEFLYVAEKFSYNASTERLGRTIQDMA